MHPLPTVCLLSCLLSACLTPHPVPLPQPGPAGASVSQLGWLAGTWRVDEAESHVEERWGTPAAGMMLGAGHAWHGETTDFFEYLRIDTTEGRLRYVASPLGGAETVFLLTEISADHATFENPGHDFPKRIRYWLTADGHLHARVDGGSGAAPAEQAEEWELLPVAAQR